MARTVEEWKGKTDDSAPSKACKLRILSRQDNKCALTGHQFVPGDNIEFDHITALWLGGKNCESNLHAVLGEAHKRKTKVEAAVRAKTNRDTAKHLGITKPAGKLRGQGFAKPPKPDRPAPKQHANPRRQLYAVRPSLKGIEMMTQNTLDAKGLEIAHEAAEAAYLAEEHEGLAFDGAVTAGIRAYLAAIRGAAAPSEEPVVEEAAKRMVDAWCRAPRGTPDWNAEWARKRSQYLKQASAVLSTTPATFFDRIEARLAKEAMVRKLWQELLEKDDRTSPADYPDMALITFEEFAAFASPAVAPVAVSVKGLEWEEIHQARSNEDPNTEVVGWEAEVHGFGLSYIVELTGGGASMRDPDYDEKNFDDPEAAKAAAQSDFNARILSSILVAK